MVCSINKIGKLVIKKTKLLILLGGSLINDRMRINT